jgi:hypothetical protein
MFKDTENKATIRLKWSLPLVAAYSRFAQRSISYFGMPGPEVLDLRAWRDHLSRKTAIQIVRSSKKQREEDLETVSNILVNKDNLGLGSQFQLLRGAVEDIILTGFDMDANRPSLTTTTGSGTLGLAYDLYNLDFEGGIHYKTGKSSKGSSGGQRLQALAELFNRQRGNDFLLFLTLNVRDTLGDEPLKFLLETAERCSHSRVTEAVKWSTQLDEGNKHLQLATWLPIYIKEQAEVRQFACEALPPVFYEGCDHARMVHFVFLCQYAQDRQLRVASSQGYDDLVQLPVLCPVEQTLQPLVLQSPTVALQALERPTLFGNIGRACLANVSKTVSAHN